MVPYPIDPATSADPMPWEAVEPFLWSRPE